MQLSRCPWHRLLYAAIHEDTNSHQLANVGGNDEVVGGVVRREALRPQLVSQRQDGVHVPHRVTGIHHRRKQRHLRLCFSAVFASRQSEVEHGC